MNLFGFEAHSVTPTTDAFLWMRWIVSVAVCWWLPGWLLLRRQLREWPAFAATYARIAAGFAWLVVLGLAIRWTGRGMEPLAYVVVAPALAFAVNRFLLPVPSNTGRTVSETSRAWWWILLSSVGLFLAQVVGFKDFSAPPHVHDASNHAFMVAQAARTGSLDPAGSSPNCNPTSPTSPAGTSLLRSRASSRELRLMSQRGSPP